MNYEIDWTLIPPQYKWSTIDEDGTLAVHVQEPEMEMYDTGGEWFTYMAHVIIAGSPEVRFIDWQRSKKHRP